MALTFDLTEDLNEAFDLLYRKTWSAQQYADALTEAAKNDLDFMFVLQGEINERVYWSRKSI